MKKNTFNIGSDNMNFTKRRLVEKINQYIGIIIPIGEKFMIGGSVQNISSGKVTNALQKKISN